MQVEMEWVTNEALGATTCFRSRGKHVPAVVLAWWLIEALPGLWRGVLLSRLVLFCMLYWMCI